MSKKTYYFPHDGNARNDEKILAVRMRFGMEGYGIYFALIEKLLESTDYILLKDYNTIAFELRVGAEKIKSIVEEFGLFVFTEDGKYFYSESFNSRMNPLEEIRDKRREAGRKGAEKRWEKLQKMANAINDNSKCHDFAMQKNSRVKKSKEENKETSTKVDGKKKDAAKAATLSRKEEFGKSLIPFMDKYGKEMIRAFFDYWSELNKSETKMRFELEKTWEVSKRLSTWANRERTTKKSEIGIVLKNNSPSKYDNEDKWNR